MDIQEDQKHPTKCNRPLASGAISKQSAIVLFLLLALSTLFVSFLFSLNLFFVLIAYFSLNISYSLGLKHIALLDIFIIATGFVLRLFAGAQVTHTPLSMWIIIITFLLAVFLALAKRRDDVLLSLAGKETRKNIDGYNLEFVNAAMVLMSGVVILSYLQYTVSAEVIARIGSEYLYLTTLFVILGILRYMQITFVEGASGSPTKILLKDRFIQITLLLWIVSFVSIVKLT
jgi:4-hydroxybenzoate polyprenyltransferase